MQITATEPKYCELSVHFEADPELISTKRTEVEKLFKDAPVSGFRKGKASTEVIRIAYRNQINEALKRALAETAFHETLFDQNIQPFGTPNFSSILLVGNKFSCDFSVCKKPTFELASYKEMQVPRQHPDFTIENLAQQLLQEVRTSYGDSVPYTENDFVENGDNVIIDYDAFEGDVHLAQFSGKGQLLSIGKAQLLDFDTNLLGMTTGETREFNVQVPANGLPSIAGKVLRFVVVLTMGSKVIPAPLNDELAQKLQKENFAQVEAMVNELASSRFNEAERRAHSQQISARLIEANQIRVPDWLSLSEAQYLAQQAGLKWDELGEPDRETYFQMAERNVKLSLILDAIRQNEPDAQLSDQEVLDTIHQMVAKNSPDPNAVLQQMNQNGYLSVLAARLRDEQTLDFVLKNTHLID
jgi:trigger factor